MSTKSYKELRWILRISSGLLIAFFLLMFIGETFFGENPGKPLENNEILQLSIMGIALIGLGLAWKWELFGGIIALTAYIVLKATLVLIWPAIAILFIVLWVLSRNNPVKNK